MLSLDARTRVGALELDVALTCRSGCLALAGPSGAGKTTILRIVAGLHAPDHGRVECAGEVWLDTGARISRPPEQRRCGFVFQDHALFPHLRAWQNVAFGLPRASRDERRAKATALLERFGVDALSDRPASTLSGGERQRVALARALARDPDVLLLDEPLAALDRRNRAGAVRELAGAIAASGAPALLVAHEFADAALLGDEVAVIDRGRVVQRGRPDELATTPASGFVADLVGASVVTGVARRGAGGLTTVELDRGGSLVSTDTVAGHVAASVFPWEVTLERPGALATDSARNRLRARVVAVTALGNRVRVGLELPQPFSAEVTREALAALGLEPGDEVVAVFKATATRLSAR